MRQLLFIFLISNALTAQTNTAWVHFDKSFYASGEVIWHKLYLPPTGATGATKMSVRATVADSRGKVLTQAFLPVEGRASCSGYFAVPFDAPSEWLRFQFSAITENQSVVLLAEASVPVFNDLAPLPADLVFGAPTPPSSATETSDDLRVSVAVVSENPPRAGQNVRLKIAVSDKNGRPVQADASLSVTDEALCGKDVFSGETVFLGQNLLFGAVFLSGIYHAGRVVDAVGQPIATPLLAALDVPTGQLFFTKSAADGRFLLKLPGFMGEHELQFRLHDGADVRVEWPSANLPPDARPLPWSAGILRYLEASHKRKKAYQLHGAVETNLRPKTATAKPIALDFQRSFRVQDYEHFSDMATFFRENTTHLAFSEKHGRLRAKMYDPAHERYFEEPPLFLVDGKATLDADFVGRLDPASVELVDFQNDAKLLRKIYPALAGGGLVRLRTLSGQQKLPPNEQADVFALPGYLPEAEFQPLPTGAGRPLLAPQLCWKPDILTDANGAAEVIFVQSEDRSRFCAEVRAQAADGRKGAGRVCWEPKP